MVKRSCETKDLTARAEKERYNQNDERGFSQWKMKSCKTKERESLGSDLSGKAGGRTQRTE